MESAARGPELACGGTVSRSTATQSRMDAAVHGRVQGSVGAPWKDNDGAAVVPDAARNWRVGHHPGQCTPDDCGACARCTSRADGQRTCGAAEHADNCEPAR